MQKVGLFTVFSLIALMAIPVHADVGTATIDKETFTIDDRFVISGTVDDENKVTLLASMKGPISEKLTRTAMSDSDGNFVFSSVRAEDLFNSDGEYTINVFTEYQRPENGTIIKIVYDDGIANLLPNFDLTLKEIGNKVVDETKKLSFTVSITDSSVQGEEYSLENAPSGATINKSTGVFSWTPTNTQSGGYVFDIVVKAEPLEDRETIMITVNDKPDATPTTTTPEPKSEPEPVKTTTTSNGLAPFVDESKDPQSYVDRYNNEANYKKWFDESYPQYSSIYEAVGLEEPKELAPFVDPNLDPQYYIDRYNNEITYKDWFDKTYPDISIYDAVGIEEPKAPEPEFGTCGEGTRLIDGVCTIFTETEYGQCGEGTELVGKVCEIIGKTKEAEKPWWQFW